MRAEQHCVEGKGKFVLVPAMKAYGPVEILLHSFLILALGGGKCVASRLGHFTIGEKLQVFID